MLLGDLVTLQTGPFGSSLHRSDYVAKGVPLVNPMHIVGGRIRVTEEHTVSAETAQRLSDFRMSAGDVVIGRRGEMGRCAVVTPREHGWLCGTGSMVIRCGAALVPTFLQRLLSSREIVEYLGQESVGSTMANLNQKVLLLVPVRVPPVAEQHRIVDAIDELMPDHEAGVAELIVALSKLTQYRQSLLKAAVEGDLTAEWRASNPPQETGAELLARILRERRARWEAEQLQRFAPGNVAPPENWQSKYREAAAPLGEKLPPLPAGWTWASVEQIGDVQLGRQRSPDKVGGESPTKYIRAANITESGVTLDDVLEMDFSESEIRTFALRAGDVLLTEASGSAEHVGRPALWPGSTEVFCFQNTVLRFTARAVAPLFALFLFRAQQKLGAFRRLSGGVGINHLSAGKFAGLAVPVPPLQEQVEIAQLLEGHFSDLNEQADAIDKLLKMAAAQRQNILRAAFSGQLVPQDPNDEPASVLLARIRAERAAACAASSRPLPRLRARQSAVT